MGRELRHILSAVELPLREPGPWHASRQLRHGPAARDLICQGLNLAVGVTDSAALGVSKLRSLALAMRGNLVEGTADRDAWERLDGELEALRAEIGATIRQAEFAGVNLLSRRISDENRFSAIAALLDSETGRLQVDIIPLDLSAIVVIDEKPNSGIMTSRYFGEDITYPYRLLAPPGRPFLDSSYSGGFSYRIGYEIAPGRPALADLLAGMIGVIDKILARLMEAAEALAAYRAVLETHHGFLKQIAEPDTRKIAALVEADMAEERARQFAGKASCRLGLQALHIANDQPRRIIDLCQEQLVH